MNVPRIASIGGTLSLSLFSKDKDADDDSSRTPGARGYMGSSLN